MREFKKKYKNEGPAGSRKLEFVVELVLKRLGRIIRKYDLSKGSVDTSTLLLIILLTVLY